MKISELPLPSADVRSEGEGGLSKEQRYVYSVRRWNKYMYMSAQWLPCITPCSTHQLQNSLAKPCSQVHANKTESGNKAYHILFVSWLNPCLQYHTSVLNTFILESLC